MATKLVEFKTDNGNTIVVEVNEADSPSGVVRATRKQDDILEEAKHSFDEALAKIQSASESAITKLRTLSLEPDEVTIEFGFNLSATFGAVIASGTAEANYKVSLKWLGNRTDIIDDSKKP